MQVYRQPPRSTHPSTLRPPVWHKWAVISARDEQYRQHGVEIIPTNQSESCEWQRMRWAGRSTWVRNRAISLAISMKLSLITDAKRRNMINDGCSLPAAIDSSSFSATVTHMLANQLPRHCTHSIESMSARRGQLLQHYVMLFTAQQIHVYM